MKKQNKYQGKRIIQAPTNLKPIIINGLFLFCGALFGFFGARVNANAQIASAQEAAKAEMTSAAIGVFGPIYTTQTAEAKSTENALLSLSLTATQKTPTESIVRVFSKTYPFEDTNIQVEKGDRVEITVMGDNPTWNCGRNDSPSPEGYLSEAYADLIYTQANACALIGSISASSPDMYFPVGSHTIIEKAPQSGTLYLGCDDSKGRFDDNPSDSKLEVKVTVGN